VIPTEKEQFAMSFSRRVCLAAVAALAAFQVGCAAKQQPSASSQTALERPSDDVQTQYSLAQLQTLKARNEVAMARVRAVQCACNRVSSAQRAAALREARQLVRRAETAPPSEQAALERRAAELLRVLQQP
jgi:hypothetical protein